MKILISEIENTKEKTQKINFSEIFEEFNRTVPVTADLTVEVTGQLIKIKGRIKAALNLTCDVCLKEFIKDIDIDVEEFFTKCNLNEDNVNEFEIKNDAFIEDLNGSDELDISDFVYQSVILSIPNKLVCGINCSGSDNLSKYVKKEITDPRLEVFKKIKIEKDK